MSASPSIRRSFSGHRLRALRVAAGISNDELARRVDRSPWSVMSYELGRKLPSVGVLPLLADELGCSIDDLFTEAA